MGDLDTKVLAQILKSKGRKGDTMLAHINPQEAALLKKRGGAGTENPETGLPEFYDDYAAGESLANPAGYDNSYYSQAPSAADFGPTRQEFEAFSSGSPAAAAMASRSTNPSIDYELPLSSYENVTSPDYAEAMRNIYGQPTTTNVMGESPYSFAGSYAPGTKPVAPGINTPSGSPGAPGAANQPPKDEYEFLKRLGLAGVSAIPGIYQARKANEQAQKGKAEQNALADPYRKESQALLEKARSGELNAVGQQQLQQMEARLRQGMESRGGVGNAQVQAQIEAFRQQLLQNQYDLGLKVSGIADQIALGAIKTGMEADRYVGELTGNYYNNMFRIISGASNQPTPPRA